jgi:hypothetical protein
MTKLTLEQREQRALARARRTAIAAEEEDRRLAERRERWRRDGSYLTLAELEAGEHCRGCGLPILDGRGDWPCLNQLTPAQRPEYEQANAAFRERHRDCRSHRWNLSGHRTAHCGFCCPPPPMSNRQRERIAAIFSSLHVQQENQDEWELALTCEHLVRRTQHRDHDRYATPVVDCPDCDTRRGVVAAKRIGPAGDVTGRISRQRLEAKLAAQATLERQRKVTLKAEHRVAELVQQLSERKG